MTRCVHVENNMLFLFPWLYVSSFLLMAFDSYLSLDHAIFAILDLNNELFSLSLFSTLQVGNEERIHVYYAHGQDNPTFVRRCYWLLDKYVKFCALSVSLLFKPCY